MSTTDFSQIYAWLDTAESRITQGAHNGLTHGAGQLQAAAEQTAAYQDKTGATRAGTVAAVISTLDDGSGQLQAAAQAANEANPGHGEQHVDLGPSEGQIAVVLTSQTDYAWVFAATHAGAHDWIGPTLDQHIPELNQAAADGVKAAIESSV
jgi:hypothetical protein